MLLAELLSQATQRHWIAAKVEAGAGLPLAVALSRALVRSLRTATGRHPERRLRRMLGVFRSFSLTVEPDGAVGLGVDVAPISGVADSGRFGDDLAALFDVMGETARELGIGVLLLVDELQEASPADLVSMNTAIHQLGQAESPLPVVFVGAGLPSLPALLAEATSYAERLYDYRSVGLLDRDAARNALILPVQQRGADWEPAALDLALDRTGGYPYFLQAVGKHVWDVSRSTTIGVDDAQAGLALAGREVDDGLYRPDGSAQPRPNRICSARSPRPVMTDPPQCPIPLAPWVADARQICRWHATN